MKATIARAGGFTLVEILLATAIFTVLLLVLTSLLSTVNRAWIAGQQQVSEFQDGRAILEIISRELAQASISPNLQFVQNPTLANFPPNVNLRANSDSIFWLGPSTSTTSGNLSEIGYYLVEDHTSSGGDVYQLRRFFVPPTDATNYQIFSALSRPTDSSALWVSSFVTIGNLSTPVASGVLAFWVRCLDTNGQAIPWLKTNVATVPDLKFNSAAHFQPAVPGQSNSFKYTNPASTTQANLLPAMVELTLVTLDPQTFRRNPGIPAQTAQSNYADIASPRDSFNQQLISNNIKNAHSFTTRVRLANSSP